MKKESILLVYQELNGLLMGRDVSIYEDENIEVSVTLPTDLLVLKHPDPLLKLNWLLSLEEKLKDQYPDLYEQLAQEINDET